MMNRDMKLENMLVGGKGSLLKICDFGYSKHKMEGEPQLRDGSLGYTGAHAFDSPQI